MAELKYPVGLQTFSEIITENYLYVDKTEIIYNLVNQSKYVFLSRPRRFGKSLLVSTLEAYFKGKKELFQNLAISSLESTWTEYPVFRFDFSGEYFNRLDILIEHINGLLDDMEDQYGLEVTTGTISRRFNLILRKVYEKFGQRVVILIDEYDKPLLDCLHNDELHDNMRNQLAAFYSVMKAADKHIKFAMITGVTRFSRVSIFSALNNLDDISMLPEYNAICGISETEFHKYFPESIESFASKHKLSAQEVWIAFRREYDGYRFAREGEFIYNPYSVLKAFRFKELGHYWFVSGSASFLVNLVKRHCFLLGDLEGAKRKAAELSDISSIGNDFVPLLYQGGYLTLKGYDPHTKEYTLGFPNHEVSEGFWESLAREFFIDRIGNNCFSTVKFLDELYDGKPDAFMKRLKALFADTESQSESNKEIHFQNMMAISCKMLGLTVHTEIRSSAGRCDMIIETLRYIYIFEFKVDGSAEEALAQIIKKDYAGRYGIDCRQIFLIGANFSTTTRTLTTPWLIESLSTFEDE
ncbi:MAG: ATP-binding protein [Muribaculaceae bacterium]|nr:ATP-binding protein [Muribaculaceae bacterium]